MKLVICIVHNRDKNKLAHEMVRAGFKFTVIGSSGGFLREGNTTLLIGVTEDELPTLHAVIQQNCQTREQLVNIGSFEPAPPGAFIPSPIRVPVGGAVLFVMNVDEFHRY